MWNLIKKAFAMGFGGRLGWDMGGFVGGLFAKIFRWIFLGAMSYGTVYGLAHVPDLPTTHPHVQQHRQ